VTVLAIGAAGPAAGLVVPELAKRGATVRAFIRDAKQSDAVRMAGASEVAIGDLANIASVTAALDGVDAIFYIAPAFLDNEAATGIAVVDAARAAGIGRFVFSSVIDPVLTLVNHSAKVPVEDAIIKSGMEFTFLQPTVFYQNMASSWPRVAQTGVFAEPWSAETRFSRVDYRDVAEVAAIALTENRLLYGTFELCANGIMDRHEMAAVMSEVLGKPVRAEKLDPDIALKGMPDPGMQAAMKAMFDFYDTRGLVGNSLTLRSVLGREPTTLEAYLRSLPMAK
jgi:uncharacterized protein YbjT (DUF2867 family)